MDNPTVPTARAATFCTECGTAGTGKFCARCGTALAAPGEVDNSGATAVLPLVPAQPVRDRAPSGREVVIDLTDDATATRQEHDELLALSDGEMPGDPGTSAAARWRRSMRTGTSGRPAVLAIAALLVLAVLAAGGYLLTGYLSGGATRDALDVSRSHMTGTVAAFTDADDAGEIADAAKQASTSAQRIEAAQRSVGQPADATERAVVAQLGAEAAVLTALSALAELPGQPLEVWGKAHAPLTKAIGAEEKTRSALTSLDADATMGLPDTGAMMTALNSTVGSALAADAVREGGALLAQLGSAANTTELRAVAAQAAEQQPAVAAVVPSLTDEASKSALTGYDRALGALAGLAKLDGENTGAWASAKSELTAAFGALAGASGPAGAGLTTQSTNAITAADKMISAAATAIADWQAATAAAIKARDEGSAALTAYADTFRAQIKSYELLRTDLQAFFDRVEDPNVSVTYFEAYDVLSQAETDRKVIRDTLTSLSVPQDVRAEHDAVVAVINRSIAAVQAAYDGSAQAEMCEEFCYYRDTPGFATFQAESEGISTSYAEVTGAWDSAVDAAKAMTAQRPLPTKPEV